MPILLDLQREKNLVDESFSIYTVRINDSSISYDEGYSSVEFDGDGDVMVNLHTTDDNLLDLVAECDIIEYLQGRGYIVALQDEI